MKFKKGFTLIELLVVIAVISLLSSIVLASLNTARAKGADAAIKNNLETVRSQAALYFANNGGAYGSETSSPQICGSANGTLFKDVTLPDSVVIERAIVAATSLASLDITNATHRARCVSNDTNGDPLGLADTWAVAVALKTSPAISTGAAKYWCVDSSGASRQVAPDNSGGPDDFFVSGLCE